MWVFTRYGFFNVTCSRETGKDFLGTVDADTIEVGSREREHLLTLQDRFPLLKQLEMLDIPRSESRYRMRMPKNMWARIIEDLTLEMDYDDFLNEAIGWRQDTGDDAYCQTLRTVNLALNPTPALAAAG